MNTYKYKVNGVDYEVEIAKVEGRIAKVNVNGKSFELEMQKPINVAKHPSLAPHRMQSGHVAAAPAASAAPASAPAAPQQARPTAPVGSGNQQKAPLPGTVTEIKVQVGQQVKVGDIVLVLEAMKMQNNIEAEFAGQVTSIVVKQGDTVMEGAVMLTIA